MGHHVIMNDWFSSPDLFYQLCSKQTGAMGTLHQNRKGVSAEIKSSKLKKGKHVSVYKDRLMIMKWKHKKYICLIITIHDDKMVPTRVQGQDKEQPKIVTDYNSGMGGVDLSAA
jgi:hypothetical protein